MGTAPLAIPVNADEDAIKIRVVELARVLHFGQPVSGLQAFTRDLTIQLIQKIWSKRWRNEGHIVKHS